MSDSCGDQIPELRSLLLKLDDLFIEMVGRNIKLVCKFVDFLRVIFSCLLKEIRERLRSIELEKVSKLSDLTFQIVLDDAKLVDRMSKSILPCDVSIFETGNLLLKVHLLSEETSSLFSETSSVIVQEAHSLLVGIRRNLIILIELFFDVILKLASLFKQGNILSVGIIELLPKLVIFLKIFSAITQHLLEMGSRLFFQVFIMLFPSSFLI